MWSKEQQDHANKLYALLIAGSYLPVTMAKDQGFHRFMKAVNPYVSLARPRKSIMIFSYFFQYKAPHYSKTSNLVNQVADDLWVKIREMLVTDCRLCSATTDLWSSKLYNDSYIGRYFFVIAIHLQLFIIRSHLEFCPQEQEKADGSESRYVFVYLKCVFPLISFS